MTPKFTFLPIKAKWFFSRTTKEKKRGVVKHFTRSDEKCVKSGVSSFFRWRKKNTPREKARRRRRFASRLFARNQFVVHSRLILGPAEYLPVRLNARLIYWLSSLASARGQRGSKISPMTFFAVWSPVQGHFLFATIVARYFHSTFLGHWSMGAQRRLRFPRSINFEEMRGTINRECARIYSDGDSFVNRSAFVKFFLKN